MNKNATAIILIVLAIGIYFTFTRPKMSELQTIRMVNAEYQQAIDNSTKLLSVRDSVLQAYNSISESDKERLNKIVPDTVDNVRLIIDVKDDIAARHGLILKDIKTASPLSETPTGSGSAPAPDSTSSKYGVVSLSFSVTSDYDQFVSFLKDLEASLRIMDISRLTVTSGTLGQYNFMVEIKTYWFKQN